MIVLDLPLYHSLLALIALELALTDSSLIDNLEVNQAYLSFIKPSNIFQVSLAAEKASSSNTGVV